MSNNTDPKLSSIIVAFSLNVVASCGTVFLNKYLFKELGFKFGTTLTVCHFFFCHLACRLLMQQKVFKPKENLNWTSVIPIALSSCGYVVFNNISLALNSVSFYQVMKLLCTPIIITIQYMVYSQKTSKETMISLIPVLMGVFITVFADMEANIMGTIFAGAAILSNSIYTVWGKEMPKKLNLSGLQLLYPQTLISGIILTFTIPFFDDAHALMNYHFDLYTIFIILCTCVTAFGVNFSFFLLVGKTSPLTTNVVGYFKTCLVFIGGILLFAGDASTKTLMGIGVTLLGTFLYTYVKYQEQVEAETPQAVITKTINETETKV